MIDSPDFASRFRLIIAQTLQDSVYLLAAFPLALASFVFLITGLSLGVGLLIIWVGVPILAGTLFVGHWFANLERVRLSARGVHVEPTRPASTSTKPIRRFLQAITSASKWREAAHGIISMPLSCISWSLLITWWAIALAGVTGWIWVPINRSSIDSNYFGLIELLGFAEPIGFGWWLLEDLLNFLIGIFAVTTMPWVLKGLCAVHAALGRILLSPTQQELQQRIGELTQAREHLGLAEASTLRRLEQDIHDGPQQGLIRLGMDLSAAERRLASGDTAAAQVLIEEARSLNDSIITSLRALSRGMIPPILAERGIVAALASVAATSPIPVSLEPQLHSEPPQQVAAAAYFVVCEALANTTKHSKASQITVYIESDDHSQLLVEVSDNGVGGAIMIPGHGLAGLAERIEALDGHLEVDNIGGTRLRATLPM